MAGKQDSLDNPETMKPPTPSDAIFGRLYSQRRTFYMFSIRALGSCIDGSSNSIFGPQ